MNCYFMHRHFVYIYMRVYHYQNATTQRIYLYIIKLCINIGTLLYVVNVAEDACFHLYYICFFSAFYKYHILLMMMMLLAI